MKKSALAAATLASAFLTGCDGTLVVYPDVGFPHPRPIPMPIPAPVPLATTFQMKATAYDREDRVSLAATPFNLGIRETLTTQAWPYGHETIERFASDTHRDRNQFNDRAPYYQERRFGKTSTFSYEDRDYMSVAQTKDRAKLRKLYNSMMNHVPRNASPVNVECIKNYGQKDFDCAIRYR